MGPRCLRDFERGSPIHFIQALAGVEDGREFIDAYVRLEAMAINLNNWQIQCVIIMNRRCGMWERKGCDARSLHTAPEPGCKLLSSAADTHW